MNRMRLVLVTRRFWPLVGDAERRTAYLASEFVCQGEPTVVVTAQWETSWPAAVVHREVEVVRLPYPSPWRWGRFRYLHALSRWLRQHQAEIDLVYISGLRHDAYTALHALQQTAVPVVLRAEGAGSTGDCHWQQTTRFGRRIRRRCLAAAAIVAPSEVVAQELQEAGYPSELVYPIADGVPLPAPRQWAARQKARAALADANMDLYVIEQAPLAVYVGPLHEACGLPLLLRAWRSVASRRPNARLWLIGEGPYREPLYEHLVDLGLHHHACLPGAFDDLDDILQAADLFVLPTAEESTSLPMLEAMAAGLPVVASQTRSHRAVLTDQQHGRLVAPGNVQALAQALLELIDGPARTAALGAAARQHVQQHFRLDQRVADYRRLFQRLVAAKRAAAGGA